MVGVNKFLLSSVVLTSGLLLQGCDRTTAPTAEPKIQGQTATELDETAAAPTYNLIMTIALDGQQPHQEVIENVALPPDEKSFCSSDLYQKSLPEGSSIVSCSFNGTVGYITLAIRLLDMNIQMKTKYEYQKQ